MKPSSEPSSDTRINRHVVIEADHFDKAMGVLSDRVTALEGSQLTKTDVAAAIGQGISQAAGDPATWCSAFRGMREAAEDQAGPWVIRRGMMGIMKLFMFVAAVLFVFSVGGPGPAWALIKAWVGIGAAS